MTWENLWTIGSALVSLVLVLLLAYITLRWMGRRMTLSGSTTQHIKVLERVAVGQDKCLLRVRVGDKQMLVGMSSHTITKLADLDELPEETPPPQGPDFSQVLGEVFGRNKKSEKREEHGGE